MALGRFSRVRAVGWAALFAFMTVSGHTPVAAEERLDDARPACGDAALAGTDFEPVRHEISTSALLGQDNAVVRWTLSSEVTAFADSALVGTRYCYSYILTNAGSTPVKISLVSHRLALSPLFAAMQDFSLVLEPRKTEVISFTTSSPPELILATAYNSARDEKISKWALVSSGPISLYLPGAIQAAYTLPD
jgi:hypothetical protein